MLVWDNGYKNLVNFLKNQKEKPFLLCDENTFDACGKFIVEKLERESLDKDLLILSRNAHADEKNICKVMINTKDEHIIVSIGSGSLTDIARFVAYKQKLRFISVPTAPSMDGYASSVAPLTINGLKTTVSAIPPEKIFVNLKVIEKAPSILKIAGFGDLMGKFTALLDWQLANLLIDEPIDKEVVKEMKSICEELLEKLEEKEFIKILIYGLIRSGELMAKVGSSRPASGSEHHISHYLEYKGYEKPYHGIKVGLATIYVIKLYEFFLNLTDEDLEKMKSYQISEDEWIKEIEENFPENFQEIIYKNIRRVRKFNDKSYRKEMINKIQRNKEKIDFLVRELIDRKEKILEGYKKMEFSIKLEDWGIPERDIKKAILYSLYIRERFTILTLYQFLGKLKEIVEAIL